MKRILTISGVVFLLFLYSCVTINEFPIEVYQPAKIVLPAEMKNVTLVARNLKYANDTLQNYQVRNYKLRKDAKPFNFDSLIVNACFDSLSSRLIAQNRFNRISVYPISSLPIRRAKNIPAPSKDIISKIATETNADALIFLDMISGFYSINPNPENQRQEANVVIASIWTIYNASTKKIVHHTSLVDTVFWDGLDQLERYSASRIPDKKAALPIAAGMIGASYSKNIVPFWSKVYRNTLSLNQPDFLKAAGLAKQNKWAEASEIWLKYADGTNNRKQMVALFNLAIASEMDGDIEKASQLTDKALDVSDSSLYTTELDIIRRYSAILAKRKIELKKLQSMSYDE
jgi:hypothetical protein